MTNKQEKLLKSSSFLLIYGYNEKGDETISYKINDIGGLFMTIRLIAMDLDGTLLQGDHVTISPNNIEALNSAAAQGISLAIASGRTLGLIPGVLEQAPMIRYTITSNGANVQDLMTQTTLLQQTIPYAQWSKFYDIIMQHGGIAEYYCENNSYMNKQCLRQFKNPQLPQSFLDDLKSHIIPVDDMKASLKGKNLEKVNIIATPQEQFPTLKETLQSIPTISLTDSLPGNLEINAKGVNKGQALAHLCEKLGLTADEVVVFGDANNDLEMLAWAKWSFAMDNGSKKAKVAARFLTASNDDDGVAKGIAKLNDQGLWG